jgi:cell division protein FtsL
MTRLNLVLLLAVLLSAMYLVNVQYESRRLFAEIDRAMLDARKIDAEKDQLLADRRAQATPLRVEKLAKERLQMRTATPAITHYVNFTPPQAQPPTAARQRPLDPGRAP